MSGESGHRETGDDTQRTSAEVDQLFDLLRDPYRRLVLARLQQHGRVSVERILNERRRGDESARDLEVSLYHVHLPKLEDTGLIEYDERSGEIVDGNWPSGLDRLLATARELDAGLLPPGSETV